MKNFLKGAAIGAVISGVVVALTTPKTGKEMRETIKEEGTKGYEAGTAKYEEVKEVATEFAGNTAEKAAEVKEDLTEKVEKVKNSKMVKTATKKEKELEEKLARLKDKVSK